MRKLSVSGTAPETHENKRRYFALTSGPAICEHFGYFDPHAKMDTARNARFFMAICVCIQLLKVVKWVAPLARTCRLPAT